MTESAPPPLPPPGDQLPPIAHLRLKAAALLLLTFALILGSVLYLLYARGAFEATQPLVLIAEDSEGVSVGMDMTFSGFPIGRVRRIELASDGNVRILIDVALRDAHWLRTSSVFTRVRGLVGGTTIKAYSSIRDDPPLPAGAERVVLSGDALAELPQLLNSARQLLEQLQALTAPQSALGQTLEEVRALAQRLNAPGGALAVLLGGDARARDALQTLVRVGQLLERLDAVVARADRQLLGQAPGDGLVAELRTAARQAGGLLQDARQSLVRLDAVLQEAQAVAANTREATLDLGALRADVERNLRQVESLIYDLQRKWPFARDTELLLP